MSVLSIRAQNSKNEKQNNYFLEQNNFHFSNTLGEIGTNKLDISTRNAEIKYSKNSDKFPLKSQIPSNTIMLSILSQNNSFNNIIDNTNNINTNNYNNNNIVKNKINNINSIINNKIKNIPNDKSQNNFRSSDFNLTNNRPFPSITSPLNSNLLPNVVSSMPNISSSVPNNTNDVPNGMNGVPNFTKFISKN